MRTIEVSAKTVDMAIEKGLQMLGVEREMVKVNVLEKESMLRKAKIEMIVFANEDEKLEAEQNVDTKKENLIAIKNAKTDMNESVERFELTDVEQTIYNRLEEFFKGLLNILNVEGKIGYKILNDNLYIILDGESLGVLIGHHGTVLDATQTLVNSIIKNEFENYKKKVFVDIENYREKRIDALEALAKRMATKVIQVQKSLKLEPMSSFERRVIHTSLQNIPNISTHSEGEEPNRYLIIDYVK